MIIRPSFYNERGGEDIFTRLLTERVILVFDQVTDDLAQSIIAQLLYLESVDPTADIQMYICSPGGSVSAGLGIYDTMRHIRRCVSGGTSKSGSIVTRRYIYEFSSVRS